MKAIALFLLPLLACGSPLRSSNGGPLSGQSSLYLIAEAVRRNEMDEDTAILYRVLAVLDDRKLPPAYRGTLPVRDGTTILRAARERYPTLPAETRAALAPYLCPQREP